MATAAQNAVEMANPETSLAESALMATPAGKTSTVGVKMVKKKKPNLNTSKRKLKSVPATPVNFSFHNMSVQKQTLRANNKALAQNLAKVKLEVRRLQKENTDLECQAQQTQQELRRLKRVVGIKDAEIEEEVQRRMQIQMLDMKKSVEDVAEYLAKMGESVSEIYLKCAASASSSRQSSLSNRSSLNLLDYSTDNQRRSQANRRSSSSSLLQAEFLAKADELAYNHASHDQVTRRRLSDNMPEAPAHPDMSVILEQSVLTEETLTSALKTNLSAVSETTNQEHSNSLVGNGRNTKLPQRIPRQTSRENLKSATVTDKKDSNKSKESTMKTAEGRSKKRDQSEDAGQTQTEKHKDSLNTVKECVNTDKRLTRSIGKDDNSKSISNDIESEECNLLGDDFDNLVSGSPIMIESDRPSRRETFSLSKAPSFDVPDQIEKEQNEENSAPSENNKTKSSNSQKSRSKEMKKDKVINAESNGPAMLKNKLKNLKSGKHVRRDTYTSENPFKPNTTLKRTPLAIETDGKQQTSTKEAKESIENSFKTNSILKSTQEIEERSKKQSSETEKGEKDIENPFKPNKTLKRTPDAEEVNDKQVSETKKAKSDIENPFKQVDKLKNTTENADKDKSKSSGKADRQSKTKEKSRGLSKQQSKSKLTTAPKATLNHHQKPENKVIVDYPMDATNPFKPTRNLLRSPPPQPKLDSKQFLAKLCNKLGTDEAAQELPEGPSFADEPTTYFNADMDLTVPLSALERRSPFMNTMENITESSAAAKDKTSDAEASNKREVKSDKLNKERDEKVDQNKQQRQSINEERDMQKATVEMRVDKPGQFTFAASRKEADGSRKPVPEKVSSRARSKKKHLTPEKDPDPPNLGPDRDLFNFGDRTPTVPLNKILQEKEKASAVYDLSMNESVVGPPISLNNFREKNKIANDLQGNTEEEKEVVPNNAESNVYHLPLKGSPQEKPKRGRGRSKSATRSKSKSRKSDHSDDENYVPYKSRSKSKSRKLESDEEYVPHKSMSRSKAKHSDDESNKSPNSKPKSRTRGRSRTRKVCAETDKTEAVKASEMNDNQPGADGKSDEQEQSETPLGADGKSDEQEQSETPLVRKSMSSRARSRARPIVTSDDADGVDLSNDDKVKNSNTENEDIEENHSNTKAKERKSRSASVRNNENLDHNIDLSGEKGKESGSERISNDTKTTDKKSKPADSVDKNGKVTEPSNIYYLPLKGSPAESKTKTRTRSSSRSRHVSDSDDDHDIQRPIKRRTRSKSRTRHVSESEDEGLKSRSVSRKSRSDARENSNSESEQTGGRKKSTSSHKTIDNDNLAKDDSEHENSAINNVKEKHNIAVIETVNSDSDFQCETRQRRKSKRQTKVQKDKENDILSETDIESKPSEKEQVLNKIKLTKVDSTEQADSSPEPARFVTKSRGRSIKVISKQSNNDLDDIEIVSENDKQTVEETNSFVNNEVNKKPDSRKSKHAKETFNESENLNTGDNKEQLQSKTPNVMNVKPTKSKSVKKKLKDADTEKFVKVAKTQVDRGDAEEETPGIRKAARVDSAVTEGREDNQDKEQPETASKSEKLPAKTPSMPKESAGTSSKSVKTKTAKSSRKKKEVMVTEDETPKAKTSRKSVKSSQKKVQKENEGPVSRLESLKRRLTTVSSKSTIADDKTEELTNHNIEANIADSEDGTENKRTRRTKNPVSYVPINLNKKLRQGDSLFQSKSPITKDKAERARIVLGQHKANLSERTVENEMMSD